MLKHKMVVTNPIHPEVYTRLAAHGEVVVNDASVPWPASVLAQHLADATAMMGFMTDRVDLALLSEAPRLQVVAAALKGFDSYDVQACTEAGIWLTIVPDLLTEPTAELAIGLAIGLGRHIRQGDSYVRSGAFQGWRSHLFGKGLRDSIVGIVGLGQVGKAIAQQLSGFGCAEILGVDPEAKHSGVRLTTLQDAVARADFLFVAVPLSSDSLGLIGETVLMQAKQGQLLINVGRGSVVDERAVLQALRRGRLGGYAADVFACEDWSLPHRPTEIDGDLLAHPQTLFTPHLGSAVQRVRLAIEHRAADNIIAVLRGETPPDGINAVTMPRAPAPARAAL